MAGYVVSFAVPLRPQLRKLLDPVMGDTLPLVTLFGAVEAAVWVSGYATATVVAVAGYVACNYWFIAPRGGLNILDLETAVGFAAYLFTCALIVGLGVVARNAHARAADRRETLRVTLGSIGDAVIITDVGGGRHLPERSRRVDVGWPLADAGRPLDRCESSARRHESVSPASRAPEGIVLSLGNHTVIRRDGLSCRSTIARRSATGGVVWPKIFRDVTTQRRAGATGRASCSQRGRSRRSWSRRRLRSSANRSTASSRAGTPRPSGCSATRPRRRSASTSRS
jgi:hypothetical protein